MVALPKVVVIGSGLGGLSCGCILQKNRYEVTVLEQGAQIGGCLQCFSRRGAKFETGMHFIGSAAPGQTMHKVMRYLGLLDTVELSPLDTDSYNTVALGGQQFHFPNGKEAFIERFSAYFPQEKDALCKYVDIVHRIASASALGSLVSANRDLNANTEYQARSINEVLDTLFKDALLKKVLVGDLPLYSAEWDKTPFSQHAFIMDFYNQSAYRVVGGSDAIASSLARDIERQGGRLFTSAKAVRICCDDVKAVGVETADGRFFPADYVISTIHPKRLLEILDTKLIRPAFRKRINAMPQTASSFALYVKFKSGTMPYMNTNFFGYDSGTPWNCEHYTPDEWPKGFLYMHMCAEAGSEWARSGVVLSYMRMEDVVRWLGTSVGHRGEAYESFKREHADRLMASVEKHVPGFRASVEEYYTSTPLTYFDYTGTEDGSMYGVAKDVRKGAEVRVPYRTKIPNLFLAGQNVNSHGMMGVVVGTILACSELVPSDTIYEQIKEANQ